VQDINSESVVPRLEEDNTDLLDSSEPMVTTKEQASLPDSLSESSVYSEEISEETTEEEELLEVAESAEEESADASRQVPEHDVEKQADKAESAKEDEVLMETPEAFAANVKEQDEDEVDEDVVEEEAELERETKDAGDEDDELAVVEPEVHKESTNDVEHQEVEGQTGSPEPEKDATSDDQRESSTANVEIVPESDQTVRDDVWSSAETSDESEASEAPTEMPVEVILSTVSPVLESPILPSQFSSASMSPVEQEEEPEPNKLDVSSEPQEVPSEKLEGVSEQVLESPTKEPTRIVEVRPRFTIAPAWQRSLASGTVSPVPPETNEANASNETPQTAELVTPIKEEQPKPARAQSSPTLPVEKETPLVQEETTPENPFGVRLRKTPVMHRYGLDGESPWSPTQTESSGAQETPDHDQSGRKPILPKKPDLLADTVMSARKIP
ncbi:hypothetical protein M9458_028987, partial [Cirrhinus mrigala]